jgi:hypothetical protein
MLVLAEVIRQHIDALGQERDLNFRRSRVRFVDTKVADNLFLLDLLQRHSGGYSSPGTPMPNARKRPDNAQSPASIARVQLAEPWFYVDWRLSLASFYYESYREGS